MDSSLAAFDPKVVSGAGLLLSSSWEPDTEVALDTQVRPSEPLDGRVPDGVHRTRPAPHLRGGPTWGGNLEAPFS